MSAEKIIKENYRYLKTDLHLGAEQPFSLLHMTDTHIALADERDSLSLREFAEKRTRRFKDSEYFLQLGAEMARERKVPIAYTGDLIDFVSYANLDFVKKFTGENDCFVAVGNHEFSLHMEGVANEAAYRERSLAQVRAAFHNDIRFAARQIHGVNLIALDNSNCRIDSEQLAMLKKEISRGMPVILMVHVPLYTKELFEYIRDTVIYDYIQKVPWGIEPDLMCVPIEQMEGYEEERIRELLADDVTSRAFELIVNAPNVRAILTGHMHINYDDQVTPMLPQYLTGLQTVREICIS